MPLQFLLLLPTKWGSVFLTPMHPPTISSQLFKAHISINPWTTPCHPQEADPPKSFRGLIFISPQPQDHLPVLSCKQFPHTDPIWDPNEIGFPLLDPSPRATSRLKECSETLPHASYSIHTQNPLWNTQYTDLPHTSPRVEILLQSASQCRVLLMAGTPLIVQCSIIANITLEFHYVIILHARIHL